MVSVQFIIAVYEADASVFLATFVEVTANNNNNNTHRNHQRCHHHHHHHHNNNNNNRNLDYMYL